MSRFSITVAMCGDGPQTSKKMVPRRLLERKESMIHLAKMKFKTVLVSYEFS